MFITFKKWTVIYILCLVLLVCGFAALMRYGNTVQTSQTISLREEKTTLIIDPGHGGEDGGAVADDGTIESQINLAIALEAAEIAEVLGWDICMTRDTDISIHDSDAETLREKKVSDLKNRVALCEETANGILISFHQNSLPSAKSVRGAQVFYNAANGSMELAQSIQEALNASINAGHPKEAKSIGESSYLMKNVTCPAVLIECGFLSNAEETHMLKTAEYQKKIALIIITAAIQHLDREAK